MGDTVAILAMDTATDSLGVAIGENENLIACATFRIPRGHSRILQPAIAHLLQHSGMDAASLSGICVGIGPGSYTGVRIAVSTAKAIAMALEVPLYPIPTLAGIAQASVPWDVVSNILIMPMLFARRGRAFGALYKKNGNHIYCVQESLVMSVADWCKKGVQVQQESGLDLVVIHDFLPKHDVQSELQLLSHASVIQLQTVASRIGHAFITLVNSGDFQPVLGEQIHHVVPEYALEVEAEVKLREREAGRS